MYRLPGGPESAHEEETNTNEATTDAVSVLVTARAYHAALAAVSQHRILSRGTHSERTNRSCAFITDGTAGLPGRDAASGAPASCSS
jgi:hypothetical protein